MAALVSACVGGGCIGGYRRFAQDSGTSAVLKTLERVMTALGQWPVLGGGGQVIKALPQDSRTFTRGWHDLENASHGRAGHSACFKATAGAGQVMKHEGTAALMVRHWRKRLGDVGVVLETLECVMWPHSAWWRRPCHESSMKARPGAQDSRSGTSAWSSINTGTSHGSAGQ